MGLDSKFDTVFSTRMSAVEDELDKQLTNIKDLIDGAGRHDLEIEDSKSNIKDTITLIKTLDARMLKFNGEKQQSLDQLVLRVSNMEGNVVKKLQALGGDEHNSLNGYTANEESIVRLED